MALARAPTHGHLLGLPIDLWVVLFEPGESEDDVLPAKVGNRECCPLGMAIEVEDCIHNLGNRPALIWRTIHIVDRDRATKFSSGGLVAFDIILTHEGSHGSTVHQCWTSFHFCGIRGLYLYLDD